MKLLLRLRPPLLMAAIGAMLTAPPVVAASPPAVVASIAPLQALAAAVMDGVAVPDLLIPAGVSEHGWAMRPRDAARLEAADLVLWIGPPLEAFLVRPLATLASRTERVTASELPGIGLLPVRTSALRGTDGPEAVAAGDRHDEAGDVERDDHGQHDDHDHDHGGIDPHLWLDPRHASVIAAALADELARLDPSRAPTYAANRVAFDAELDTLTAELRTTLAPLRGRPFIVTHDAYQYFERAFDIPSLGSIAISPELPPGAARVATLRERIASGGPICVMREPQVAPRILEVLTRGTGARVGLLDPLGPAVVDGAQAREAYPELLRHLAAGLAECLGGRT